MDWTEKQIIATLRLIEQSDYDEVKLEAGNLKLHVRKRGAPAALESEAAPPAASHAATGQGAPSPRSAPRQSTAEIAIPPGMTAIRAPMIGTFYRAPAPHLPPFVQEGATVKADDTVCLVEVMKLFNTIKAGVSGTVMKIVAQNAATVAKDEVLIIIEPQR